jgi:hypothetical protein
MVNRKGPMLQIEATCGCIEKIRHEEPCLQNATAGAAASHEPMCAVIQGADIRPRPAMAGRSGARLRCQTLQQAASRSIKAAKSALNSVKNEK